ncbi:MAG: hypothetical protein SF187_17085 [Deltaproteobacteria bacterium]|nr:hypothetical protein [Deltaproteobacteria bacterium]
MSDTVCKHTRSAVESLVQEGRAALASRDESDLATWAMKVKDFERRESEAWLANEGPSLSTPTLNDLALGADEEDEPTPAQTHERLVAAHATLAHLLVHAEFADELG